MSVSSQEKEGAKAPETGVRESGLGETLRIVFHAVIIAVVIRTFVFQPFSIPSPSMESTLLVGDYLFVSKFSYGFSHYSLPWSPRLFSGRIFASQPKRGDVVVFRLPREDDVDYIKRLIGLPGDRIQMINGVLNINGVAVKREPMDDYRGDDGERPVRRWRETLPNGVSYTTLDLYDNAQLDKTATTRPTAVSLPISMASASCRPKTWSAGRRSSSSPSGATSRPGIFGAGLGRCAGTACLRLCDEPQDERTQGIGGTHRA
jgi:signal peptidase I